MKTNRRFPFRSLLGSAVVLALAGGIVAAFINRGIHVGPDAIAATFGAATVFCLLALTRVGRARVRLPMRPAIVAPVVVLRTEAVRRPTATQRLADERVAA